MGYSPEDFAIEAALNLAEDARVIHQENIANENTNDSIYCIDCDEEIPSNRRLAIPNVDRCIECQSIHENSDKQFVKFKLRDQYVP